MNKLNIETNKNQTSSEKDPYTLIRYEMFYRHFKTNYIKVLDFGCNTGRGGDLLKKLNPQLIIIGADIIPDRLEQLSKESYYRSINLNDYKITDYISNVDVIVSGEVIEHIEITQLVINLSEFYKILSDDGKLLLTTPNPDSILVKLGRNRVLKDPSHINIMKHEFIVTLLKKIGFSRIRVKGSGKAIKYFGLNFPILNIYGSYLIVAQK
ncbi:MAG: class I SAM-dependent methyltransferase [Bacteroidia bacterium]